jgi:hypothetical protein
LNLKSSFFEEPDFRGAKNRFSEEKTGFLFFVFTVPPYFKASKNLLKHAQKQYSSPLRYATTSRSPSRSLSFREYARAGNAINRAFFSPSISLSRFNEEEHTFVNKGRRNFFLYQPIKKPPYGENKI